MSKGLTRCWIPPVMLSRAIATLDTRVRAAKVCSILIPSLMQLEKHLDGLELRSDDNGVWIGRGNRWLPLFALEELAFDIIIREFEERVDKAHSIICLGRD